MISFSELMQQKQAAKEAARKDWPPERYLAILEKYILEDYKNPPPFCYCSIFQGSCRDVLPGFWEKQPSETICVVLNTLTDKGYHWEFQEHEERTDSGRVCTKKVFFIDLRDNT